MYYTCTSIMAVMASYMYMYMHAMQYIYMYMHMYMHTHMMYMHTIQYMYMYTSNAVTSTWPIHVCLPELGNCCMDLWSDDKHIKSEIIHVHVHNNTLLLCRLKVTCVGDIKGTTRILYYGIVYYATIIIIECTKFDRCHGNDLHNHSITTSHPD